MARPKVRKLRETPIPRSEQFSAGGVAWRGTPDDLEVALVLMIPDLRWQLPKGIIDAGETPEDAALREVREEAGIACELIAPIDTISYRFMSTRDGGLRRINKTVQFFLMRFISGDVADHDHEVADAVWAKYDEALNMLRFENEREIVIRARQMISEICSEN